MGYISDNYYTITQVAKILGYAGTATLRKLCIAEKIPLSEKIADTWFIPKEWVKEQEKQVPKGTGNRGEKRI